MLKSRQEKKIKFEGVPQSRLRPRVLEPPLPPSFPPPGAGMRAGGGMGGGGVSRLRPSSRRRPRSRSTRLRCLRLASSLRRHPFPVPLPGLVEVRLAVRLLPLGVRPVRYGLDSVRYGRRFVRYAPCAVRNDRYGCITRLPIVAHGGCTQAGFGLRRRFGLISPVSGRHEPCGDPPAVDQRVVLEVTTAAGSHGLSLSGWPCRSRVFGVPSRTSRFARRRISSRQAPRSDRKSTRLNSSHSQISYAVF